MIRYGLVLCLLVVSCSKFEHTDLNSNPKCQLCEWADERAGVYSGFLYASSSGTISPVVWDTVNFTVEHVFLNQSSLDDSTRMYFQVHEEWAGGQSYDWICSTMDTLDFLDGERWNRIRLLGDSLYVEESFSVSPQSMYFKTFGTFFR